MKQIIDPKKFTIIAGPCAIEGYSMAIDIASEIKEICDKYDFNYIFKGSFDKANRKSISSFRGISFEDSMKVFSDIKEQRISCTTDVHEPRQVKKLYGYVDIIKYQLFYVDKLIYW